MKRTLRASAFFLLLIAIWHFVANAGVGAGLLPTPWAVARYFSHGFADGTILDATIVTMRRLGTGYVIGAALGLPMGLVIARSRLAADTLGVLALGMQTLPSVCWVPLALIWFGQTEGAILIVVVMGTVWSIALATEHGLRSVPPIYARAARTMGSKPLHTWTQVILPASLPFVVSGMKQGWAFAWRSLMAAEIYVIILTGQGLGLLLHNGRETMSMDQVLGVMIVIVVVGLLVDRAVFAPVERLLHRRWGTGAA